MCTFVLTLEATKPLGGSIGTPPPSTFNTIHPIDMKFSIYNKLHLYFQLSEVTWNLIGFHEVTGGRHLEFLNFQILFKFSLSFCTSN